MKVLVNKKLVKEEKMLCWFPTNPCGFYGHYFVTKLHVLLESTNGEKLNSKSIETASIQITSIKVEVWSSQPWKTPGQFESVSKKFSYHQNMKSMLISLFFYGTSPFSDGPFFEFFCERAKFVRFIFPMKWGLVTLLFKTLYIGGNRNFPIFKFIEFWIKTKKTQIAYIFYKSIWQKSPKTKTFFKFCSELKGYFCFEIDRKNACCKFYLNFHFWHFLKFIMQNRKNRCS